MDLPTADCAAAYEYCERLARSHYENFPVASRLLPAAMRPHVAAVYAFARRADDFADEPGMDDGERLRLLDAWGARLRGECVPLPEHLGADFIFAALSTTMRSCGLPASLFTDLLSAFRQDVTTTRYATWRELLDYCRRSANPVGRLVLRIGGYDAANLDAQSDAVCTALQLTNFWQDLAIDWRRGRLYVPGEDASRAGAQEADLDAGRITSEWQTALRGVAARTRTLYDVGRPVCDAVRGRLRWELRVTWLGGSSILDRLEAERFDVFKSRPALRLADSLPLLWRAVRWSAASGERRVGSDSNRPERSGRP
jgi:hydroxysqualene synthase